MHKTKILVLVDVQNDFIDGALKNEDAIKVVPNIVKKAKEFNGDYVFVTRDTHDENYLNTLEGKNLPFVHCVKGTDGWNINSDLAKVLMDKDVREETCVLYFNKPTFGSYALAEAIRAIPGELDIEICGFCTDICVVSNALLVKAAVYDRAKVKVLGDLCAGVTPESHEAALNTMRMCQIDVI